MSDPPFSGSPANPYSSPAFGSSPRGNPLQVPAIFLIVLSALFLCFLFVRVPLLLIDLQRRDLSTPAGLGEFIGEACSSLIWMTWMIGILAGSICMLRLKAYSVAWTAAILAVVPICSPCFILGIPFGIWALILLRQPAVRSSFG